MQWNYQLADFLLIYILENTKRKKKDKDKHFHFFTSCSSHLYLDCKTITHI